MSSARLLRRFGRCISDNLKKYLTFLDHAQVATGKLRSEDVSRIDLIVRWGGGRRLSGFLPAQSVYADIYVREEYWPDFEVKHFEQALAWYKKQDRSLGG